VAVSRFFAPHHLQPFFSCCFFTGKARWLSGESARHWFMHDTAFMRDFSKTVHSAVNVYPTGFRAGEGEGGEQNGWHPTSVTPLPVQVRSLTTTFPITIIGSGIAFTSYTLTWPSWKLCE